MSADFHWEPTPQGSDVATSDWWQAPSEDGRYLLLARTFGANQYAPQSEQEPIRALWRVDRLKNGAAGVHWDEFTEVDRGWVENPPLLENAMREAEQAYRDKVTRGSSYSAGYRHGFEDAIGEIRG